MNIEKCGTFRFPRNTKSLLYSCKLNVVALLCLCSVILNSVSTHEIPKTTKTASQDVDSNDGTLERKTLAHPCPLCGIDSSNPRRILELHKIFECTRLEHSSLISYVGRNVSSFICRCKYARDIKKGCGSSIMPLVHTSRNDTSKQKTLTKTSTALVDIDHLTTLDPSLLIVKPCLIAHVGMAVKGFNLMYRHWVNKENCFNLCINTTIKNGFDFDCRSFEHWHSECASNSATESPTNSSSSSSSQTWVMQKMN